jgi:exosortase
MQVTVSVRVWLIGLLACVVTLAYWPTTVFLYEKWSDVVSKTYTHGWLILLICAALVIRSRRELASALARASPRAHLALAGVVLAWLVCYRAGIQGLAAPLQPLIFWLAVTAAFGWAVGRVLLFPVAYFYFAVPIWYGTPLKDLTVLVVHAMLRLTGPPALFAGDLIYIPNGSFRIEEGCSGVHFMIVGLAVAALYGEQQRDPWRTRVRQLALMAGLALIANWVRVYTIIEAGYLSNMQSYLVRVSHYGFGWGVFAAALLVFFWLATRFGPYAAAQSISTDTALAPTRSLRSELTGFASAAAILIALPLMSVGLRLTHPAPPGAGAAPVVNAQAPWRTTPLEPGSSWLPVFPGADEQRRYAFANPAGATVEILAVSYRSQRQDAQLAGESSSVIGDEQQIRAEQVVDVGPTAYREAEVTDHAQTRSLIWWRYEVAGRSLVDPRRQQLWYGLNAIVGNPSSALVALRTACRVDCDSARRTLREFLANGNIR